MPSSKKLASLRLDPALLERVDDLITRHYADALARPSRNALLTAWISAALDAAELPASPHLPDGTRPPGGPDTWWITRRVPGHAEWLTTTDVLTAVRDAQRRAEARAFAEGAANAARRGTLLWGGLGGTRAVLAEVTAPTRGRLLLGVAVPDDRGAFTVVTAVRPSASAEAVAGGAGDPVWLEEE